MGVIEEMHKRLSEVDAQSQVAHQRLSSANAPSTTVPKKELPDPERYDGENRAAYPAFELNLKAKVIRDKETIGAGPDQVWYRVRQAV